MSDTTMNVLVAAYPSVEGAGSDFDTLTQMVAEKTVRVEGVIVVTHATDGAVAVRQTGDHRGRKGAGWGGGSGHSSRRTRPL